MNWTSSLSREDLLENLELYRDHPNFIAERDWRLKTAVHQLDLALTRALLNVGAGPDVIEPWHDSLQHHLVHEYQAVRSTQGDTVVAILELLLSHGANPNHVGCNNWRGVDQAIDRNIPQLVEVFIRHGADPIQREFQ